MARRRMQSPDDGDVSSGKTQTRNRPKTAASENSDSQQLLAVGSMLSKPPNDAEDLSQLRETISKDQKHLKGLLGRRTQQAEIAHAQRHDEISSALLSALQPGGISAKYTRPTYHETKVGVNTFTSALTTVLGASGDLLGEYVRLNKVIAELHDDQAAFDSAAWDRDVMETEDKLRLGARVATKRVTRALGAKHDSKDGECDAKTAEDEAQDIGDGQREEDLEFYKSMNYAQRGIRRMVKAVPDNEE